MPDIKPYKIDVPQEKLDKLKKKIDDFEWPTELEDAGWQYGSPKADIEKFVKHWRNDFDWRAHEKRINETYPQFEVQVDIDGFGPVDMHFLHQKSDVPGAIPLLFVHGWPGSFLEATKMIPYMKGGNGNPAFHLVAPSLPNYGFSGGMFKKNFNIRQYCESMHKVMLALGYNEYVAQGGDWGFVIVRGVSYLFPESVKAVHVNWAWAAKPEFTADNPEPEYSEREKKQMALGDRWFPFGMGEGRGYIAIQSTRPGTINFMIRDSPVGLLAWIWDKLVDWSDEYPWTADEVCLWVSIYVFSRAGPDAASHIYYSAIHDQEITFPILQGYIDKPLGIADFPVEICNNPVAWRHTMGPIVSQKIFPRGGHFAGWEKPEEVATQLCEMFGKGGGAYGVVPGKDGY